MSPQQGRTPEFMKLDLGCLLVFVVIGGIGAVIGWLGSLGGFTPGGGIALGAGFAVLVLVVFLVVLANRWQDRERWQGLRQARRRARREARRTRTPVRWW